MLRTLSTVLLACAAQICLAQSTGFTYQGRLEDGGALADGSHDMRFRLFDAHAGGAQVGQTICVDNRAVFDGLFSVQLDFGQQFATAAQRHLEIEVRRDSGLNCSNAAGFVTLLPRQTITATPLASHASSAFALDAPDGSPAGAVLVDNAGQVGIGVTNPGKMLQVGDVAVPNSEGMIRLASRTSSGGGAQRIWDFGVPETGDTVTGPGYSFVIDDVLLNIGPEMMVQWGTGNVGIGTTSPQARLDVRGDIRLGPSAQFFVPAGEENLRIVRGKIDTDGTILRGSGFTVDVFNGGFYEIRFTRPFSAPPTVTASVEYSFDTDVIMTWGQETASRIGFVIWNNDGSDVDPQPFHFIAVGPR